MGLLRPLSCLHSTRFDPLRFLHDPAVICQGPDKKPVHRGFSVGCILRVYDAPAKGIELSSLSLSIGGGTRAPDGICPERSA